MKVILDGLFVLTSNWQVVSGILFILITSQFLIDSIIRRNLDEELSSGEYYSLGAAGWLLPASLLSLLWYLLKTIQAPESWIIPIIIVTLFISVFFLRPKISIRNPGTTGWILFGFLGIFVLLRLAFISKTQVPLYFDSAQHYMYIKNFTGGLDYPSADGTLQRLKTNYYHFGFHVLTAFITTSLGIDIKNAMLILGQIILAITPIPLFFIIKYETRSNSAGMFAVLLAGFGWYMPAYAMNWGKYPTLASLPLLQFVLNIAYLLGKQKNTLSPPTRRWLNVILGLGILTSVFFHSRSLVVFGIAFLAWTIAVWRQQLPRVLRFIFGFALMAGTTIEIILIQRQDMLKPLLDPYINKGLLITAIILVLLFFAIKFYSDLTFTCMVATFLLVGSVFIPVTGLIPGYGNLTLLDRPFVETILFLPLSLLGGLGFTGLLQYLRQYIHLPLDTAVGVLFPGLVMVNALINYNFYPSDCCNIVGPDDLTTIDWMDKNLPTNARILIATTELMVLPSGSFQGYVGEDAGIWISPLTGRPTFPMPYNSNFNEKETLDILCKRGVNYIYVGEIGKTFDDTQIKPLTTWYKTLLSMPKAGVYQIVGCG